MKKNCLFVVVCSLILNPFQLFSADIQANYISIETSASMELRPDEIVISFVLRSENADIMVAKNKNSEILKKVTEAVKKYGVTEKDILLDNLNVELKREKERVDEEQSQRQLVTSNKGIFIKGKSDKQSDGKGKIIGYTIFNQFSITVKTPENVEAIIAACFSEGVNDLNGINFYMCDQKKYRDELRVKAVTDAKEKATKMAAALGCRIGQIIYIGNIGQDECDCSPAKSKITIKESVNVKFELR